VLAKLSLLILYARIFAIRDGKYRIILWIIGTWVILWVIGVYLDVFLECRPLDSIWTEGCAPSFPTSVTTGVFNVVSDLAIVIFPQPIIWKLQMPVGKKIGVAVVILFGLL
jgi:hypothetical protein